MTDVFNLDETDDTGATAQSPVPDPITTAILNLVAERGVDKTLDPTEVARAIGGPHPDHWGPLMFQIRSAIIKLALEGRIIIYRKGRPVDPKAFKGVYRIGLPRPD